MFGIPVKGGLVCGFARAPGIPAVWWPLPRALRRVPQEPAASTCSGCPWLLEEGGEAPRASDPPLPFQIRP